MNDWETAGKLCQLNQFQCVSSENYKEMFNSWKCNHFISQTNAHTHTHTHTQSFKAI